MALFGSKKKIETTDAKVVAKKEVKTAKPAKTAAVIAASVPGIRPDVIIRPRVTEKAGIQNEKLNVYTFEVSKASTKHSVAHAMKTIYKVTPEKVRMVNLPAKSVLHRGRPGTQSGVKKALVYLKKGDKIEIA